MPYHIDDAGVPLHALVARIKDTDLIPSRAPLLSDIDAVLKKLEDAGLKTLADFRRAAKNPKGIDALSVKSGVGVDYLTLLRREEEGYFPKAPALRDFGWLDQDKIAALERGGYTNAARLFEAVEAGGIDGVPGTEDTAFTGELAALCALTRI